MTPKHAYIEHYGCAANKFDLEIILAHLTQAGYDVTRDVREADMLLVNTCGVKQPTEDRVLAKLRVYSGLKKPLIIAGCLPKINREAIHTVAPNFAAMLDPQSLDRIPAAIRAAERGERHRVFMSETPRLKLKQPKIRLNPAIEIISIAEGCVGACTFCCVKVARGALRSHPREMIVERVRQAVAEGVKEVWMTGQDSGGYGQDIGTNLVDLLRACCRVEGGFRIRVGMMNPNHVPPMLPELIKAYKAEKVFKFLHLPVQSGDDHVLQRMNRHYTARDFKDSVYAIREEIPDLTLATDVICGFPGESPEDFERTLHLIEEVQPDIVHVSKFASRPHTAAKRMTPLNARDVKNRSRRLTRLVAAVSRTRNSRWRTWEGDVLIDEKGRGNSWIGRNFAYKPIVIHTTKPMLGRVIRVRVTATFNTYLEGEVINRHSEPASPTPPPKR
jgi:threonylcarbamoyladenosine tRNA methylthiotransferase CDKAL1